MIINSRIAYTQLHLMKITQMIKILMYVSCVFALNLLNTMNDVPFSQDWSIMIPHGGWLVGNNNCFYQLSSHHHYDSSSIIREIHDPNRISGQKCKDSLYAVYQSIWCSLIVCRGTVEKQQQQGDDDSFSYHKSSKIVLDLPFAAAESFWATKIIVHTNKQKRKFQLSIRYLH